MRFVKAAKREKGGEKRTRGACHVFCAVFLSCQPNEATRDTERYRERSQKPANSVGWKNKANSSVGYRLARLR